jgi:Methyltransferase domain
MVSDHHWVENNVAAVEHISPKRGDKLTLLSDRHSFGYFTDISNDDWRHFYQQPIQRQQHQQQHAVLVAPNGSYWKQQRKNSNGKKINGDILDAQWLYYNYNPIFVCPHARKIGDPGGKWMCDPERFYQALLRRLKDDDGGAEAPHRLPCLIYSVGSKGNFRWEDDMIDFVLQGRIDLCEIHIFDPFPLSQYYKDPQVLQQVQARLLHRNMYYHAWGWIGTNTTRPARGNKSNFKTLPETRHLLGHDDEGLLMLDILKLDCEGCEWETSFDWLYSDSIHIRHLLLESHSLPWSDQIRRTAYYGPFPVLDIVHGFFERLLRVPPPLIPPTSSLEAQLLAQQESIFQGDNDDGAFVLYSKEVNTHRGEGRCVEWSFLRLQRDFFTK